MTVSAPPFLCPSTPFALSFLPPLPLRLFAKIYVTLTDKGMNSPASSLRKIAHPHGVHPPLRAAAPREYACASAEARRPPGRIPRRSRGGECSHIDS